MDPKSEWALGEFRDAPIELRLLEHSNSSSGAAVPQAPGAAGDSSPPQHRTAGTDAAAAGGGRRRVLSIRSAYQGERLAGLLVVKFDTGAGGEERRTRWRQFGAELNVELEITTEAVASAGTAFVSEEPSLWRDYEGRENARDRGVLARSNRTVTLAPDSSLSAKDSSPTATPTGELVYTLDVEVQVPVEFLGQKVALEALVSPAAGGQREGPGAFAAAAAAAAASAGGGGGSGGGGRRRGGGGGDFANRLDSLFALSRVAPVRLPVRRCLLPLRVVQPITVTSRSCPSSSSSSSPAAGGGGGGNFAGAIGRCLVALEIRNDHPVATVTVHDVEVHVDATARCGERASSLGFSAPGKAGGGGSGGGVGGGGGGGARSSGRRKMSGEVPKGGASAPLEGLDGSIEQPLLAGPGGGLGGGAAPATGGFSRVFCASWMAKPALPLVLAPGEVQGFVLSIYPAGEPLPPRRAGGRFESPVTFVWNLDTGGANAAGGGGGGAVLGGRKTGASAAVATAAAAAAANSSRRSSPRSPPATGSGFPRLPPPRAVPTTTSVHLAQWQSEQRARNEVLVRVKGQPRVKLNRVFEVFLRVRNLSDSARDLVIMFTENPSGGCQRGGGGGRQELSLDGSTVRSSRRSRSSGGGGAISIGSDDGIDDEGGAVKDISPSASPAHDPPGSTFTGSGDRTAARAGGPSSSRRPPPPPGATTTTTTTPAADALAFAGTPTSLRGDLLPVDAAVPLGRLERGAEHGATVRLTAARAGLARLSSLCLRDALTGSVYVPACPYEVFVEN